MWPQPGLSLGLLHFICKMGLLCQHCPSGELYLLNESQKGRQDSGSVVLSPQGKVTSLCRTEVRRDMTEKDPTPVVLDLGLIGPQL